MNANNTNKSGVLNPALSLPKGGGAVSGIGETFQPNLFTGTGNFSVPVYTSPGRGGFGPKLALQYSTGSGNGLFGLGWQISMPQITRKTEKGLPRYDDHDVFVLSGAEDLVPIKKESRDTGSGINHVTYFRPRTEGLFARIEHWQAASGDDYWRVITKENITSIYGRTQNAQIHNPDDPTKIYSWLLQETYDAKGNHILYEYAQEDPELTIESIHEQNRTYSTQRYIRRIYYGNAPNALADEHKIGPKRGQRHYFFEVLFDYGDLPAESAQAYRSPPTSTEYFPTDLTPREDAFSTYRPGFEVRTLRRCRQILMVHHFNEPGVGPGTLVKSTDFAYIEDPHTKLALLKSVMLTGYQRKESDYTGAKMPPVTFDYTVFHPQEQHYQSLSAEGNHLPSTSLADANTTLVDLNGNGIPDILETAPSGFRFWENLGNGHFERPRSMPHVPAGISLSQPGVAFADMAGDGRADLLVIDGPLPGFYETHNTPDIADSWHQFQSIQSLPSIGLADPNVRLLDLTGDGLTDILMTRDHHFLWYRCLGEEGYAEPEYIERIRDLDEFPDVYFSDPGQRVRLADMTGDGLNDIVLVHNGRIEYWPNLGYGRFGRRILMGNAPRLETDFDPTLLFLADLDGSGVADLVYVNFNSVRFWFNQSGNSWSDEQQIQGTPVTINATNLQFTDVFGLGTSCLVWSYDYGTVSDSNYKVLDFCGGIKPYLLDEMSNNMGATTRVAYASSTDYYLQDVAQGSPWATPLPFPVQVIAKTEVIDHLSKTKLTSTYAYHHGYFDGREREFRGFGRVDQFDTETFDDFEQGSLHQGAKLFNNNQHAYHVPPIETRTWFHTGAYFDEDILLEAYSKEYWQGDNLTFELPGHTIETSLEAYRALRGTQLRQEVYARDDSEKQNIPYTVTEMSYKVNELLAPATGTDSSALRGVYLTTPEVTFSYHYERNPLDPRIQQTINLAYDQFGNLLRNVSIGYPRRPPLTPFMDENGQPVVNDQGMPIAPHTEQRVTKAVYTFNSYINKPDAADCHYVGINCESKVYEVHGLDFTWPDPAHPNPPHPRPIHRTVFDALSNPDDYVGFEDTNVPGLKKRIVDWKRVYFKKDAMPDSFTDNARLPLCEIEPLGLPFESYQVAFDKPFIENIFGADPFADHAATWQDVLQHAGYSFESGFWWVPSGRAAHHANTFFLPDRQRDPFGNESKIDYDSYALLPIKSTDPLNNVATSENDYRVLQPYRVTDPNHNISTVAFDTLGLVVATAQMGKITATEFEGETLEGVQVNLSQVEIGALFTPTNDNGDPVDPRSQGKTLLANASTRLAYDLFAYKDRGAPIAVATITREIHAAQPGGNNSPVQVSYLYSDGFGRELQTKVQAEPTTPNGSLRWAGTGTRIYNNKGKPVREFEPFFSNNFAFGIEQHGVSPTLFYDPVERVIATLNPNHTYEKVVFDPWRQETWDANDTVRLNPKNDSDIGAQIEHLTAAEYSPTWDEFRSDPNAQITPAEKEAAEKAAAHAGTPTVAHLDTLGRAFLTVAHSRYEGQDEFINTHVTLDIESNDLLITDPRGIQAFIHSFDIAGRKLVIESQDAGLKKMLPDVQGNPVYTWDANGNRVKVDYDALHRPTQTWNKPGTLAEFLADQIIYGEAKPASEATNHHGQVWKIYDSAGMVINERFDFKGNPEQGSRRLLKDGTTATVHWPHNNRSFDENAAHSLLETLAYTTKTEFDALSRVTHSEMPDGTVQEPHYNEANLLDSVTVKRSNGNSEIFVKNIDYNARGQRTRIEYGNGVITTYTYETETFRLSTVNTTRKGTQSPKELQQLIYTYDPMGNITEIRDDAHPKIFNRNQVVEPRSRYVYDAIYRLRQATGREHESMTACHYQHGNNKHTEFLPQLQSTNNAQALVMYTEVYNYDVAGNITRVQHTGAHTTTRTQRYADDSNRIVSSKAGCSGENISILHDANGIGNGNITKLSHLPDMQWDFKNQLVNVQLNEGVPPNQAFYQYDASGQRVRKTVVKNNGFLIEERIYLGGYEIYLERNSNGVASFRRDTIHVMDDTNRIALIEEAKDTRSSSIVQSSRVRYQLSNHLGSAVLELDDTQNADIISYEEYYPYGGTAYMAGHNRTETSLKRYRYSGKERDDETGLYYYGARYYAAWLGRWVSADPIGARGGGNLFQFVSSNPVNLVDKAGMQPEKKMNIREAKQIIKEVDQIHKKSTELAHRKTDKNKVGKNNYMKKVGIEAHKISQKEIAKRFPHETITFEEVHKFEGTDGKNFRNGTDLDVRFRRGLTIELKNTFSSINIKFPDMNEYQKESFLNNEKQAIKQINVAAKRGDHYAIVEGDKLSKKPIFWSSKEVSEISSEMNLVVKNSKKTWTRKGKIAVAGLLNFAGKALTIFSIKQDLQKVVAGVRKGASGNLAEGAIDVGEGATGLTLTGVEAAAGTSGFVTALAGIAVGGSFALVADTARAAVKGEKTPIEDADQFYGTHFGDLYSDPRVLVFGLGAGFLPTN